jgi:hypothetical protein
MTCACRPVDRCSQGFTGVPFFVKEKLNKKEAAGNDSLFHIY